MGSYLDTTAEGGRTRLAVSECRLSRYARALDLFAFHLLPFYWKQNPTSRRTRRPRLTSQFALARLHARCVLQRDGWVVVLSENALFIALAAVSPSSSPSHVGNIPFWSSSAGWAAGRSEQQQQHSRSHRNNTRIRSPVSPPPVLLAPWSDRVDPWS